MPHNKRDKEKMWWHKFLAIIMAICIVGNIVTYIIDFKNYQQKVTNIVFQNIELANMKDGTYQGEYNDRIRKLKKPRSTGRTANADGADAGRTRSERPDYPGTENAARRILISMAIAIYFGDWIKTVLPINMLFLLLFVQLVYVGIRWYVKGWRETRGYS